MLSQNDCTVQTLREKGKEREGVMLPAGLEHQFNAFCAAVYADGEVDGKTKALIGMAVAMALGCAP